MEVWLVVLNVALFVILIGALSYCLFMLKSLRETKAKQDALGRRNEPIASLLRPGYEKGALGDDNFTSDDEAAFDERLDVTSTDVISLHQANEEDAGCCVSDEETTNPDKAISAYGEEPLLRSGTLRNEPTHVLKHEGLRMVASLVYRSSSPNFLAGKVTGLFDLPDRKHRFDMYRVEIVLLPSKKYILSTKFYSAWISCRMNEYFKFSFKTAPNENAALRIRVHGLKLTFGVAGKEYRVAETYLNMNHVTAAEKGILFNRVLS